MSIFFEFIEDIKQYRKRSLVYLMITIVVSILISFVTWWFQQQTIHDLRLRLLTNQSNLQSQITQFEQSADTVPELQKATLQILNRIESKLSADVLSYKFESLDTKAIAALCELKDDFDFADLDLYYFQPFYSDLNLEPIFVVNNLDDLTRLDLNSCISKNKLFELVVDSDTVIWLPMCYLNKPIEGESNDCYQFIKESFLNQPLD